MQKGQFTSLIFIILTNLLFAQENAGYKRDLPLNIKSDNYHGAVITNSKKLQASLYYRQYLHSLSEYYQSESNFRHKTNKLISTIQLNTENEGPFIRRTRAYLEIGTQLALSSTVTETTFIGGGIQTLAFESQTDAIAGSATAPDSRFGTDLHTHRLSGVLPVHKTLNNSIK